MIGNQTRTGGKILISLKTLSFCIFALLATHSASAAEKSDSSESTRSMDGVYFYGIGNEPFWNVKINNDRSVEFGRLGEATLYSPPVQHEETASGTMLYKIKTESASFVVEIFPEECTDNMSGEKFTNKVTVVLEDLSGNAKLYSGCGNYSTVRSLKGKWYLRMIGSDEISAGVFGEKMPYLEFSPEKMGVNGIAGCNSIAGRYEQNGSRISLGNLASTMMACPEAMREDEILKALRETESFEIRDDLLLLSGSTGLLLTYEKAVTTGNADEGFTGDVDVRLNDIYVLESFEGVEAKRDDYMKDLPRLEFSIKEMRYHGTTGCNNLFGSFTAGSEGIRFGPAGMTRMMCPGNYEQKFIKALNEADRYKIEDMRLSLYAGDRLLMVLKKVD